MKILGRSLYREPVKWIAPANVSRVRGCVFRARKSLSRELLGDARTICIAAESYYALYVNGVPVGKGPARGTRVCNFVDTHDVSSQLQPGENIFAVEVFCNNFPTFLAAPAEPAVFLSIGRWTTDETWDVQLAGEYRSEGVDVYTLQIGLSEWRDLRGECPGWSVGMDASEWNKATVLAPDSPVYAKALYWRDVVPLQERRLWPKKVPVVKRLQALGKSEETSAAIILSTEPHFPCDLDATPLIQGESLELNPDETGGDVTLICDMGQEFIGHLELEIEAPAGTILDIGYEEVLLEERLQLSLAHYRFADHYILREGRQIVSSPLRWRGGRYVQLALRGFDRVVRIRRLCIVDRRYPISEPAGFSCDREWLNDLWKRCSATLSACVTDTVMDCPWREMAFWVNDFLVVNRYWLQMVGHTDLLRRSLALALSQREPSGLIGGVCPTNDNPFFTLFATNMFLPIILQDYLTYTGDRATVDLFIEEAIDLVHECEKHATPDGLLCPPKEQWNFVDWSFHFVNQPLEGKNTCVVNWFHVLALKALANLHASDQPKRSAVFREKAQAIADQIDLNFWDETAQCYREWLTPEDEAPAPVSGKLTHALAVLSGLAHPNHQAAIARALTREDLHLPELYMMHFVFEALVQIERLDEVMRLIARHWGSILETDSPTIWEANVYEHGKTAFSNTGSLCHAFALAPVNIFQRYVLGITPLAEGFQRFRVHPQMGDLKELRGSVPTQSGFIFLESHREETALAIKLTVPPFCIAELADGREFAAGEHRFHIECLGSFPAFEVSERLRETQQRELVGS